MKEFKKLQKLRRALLVIGSAALAFACGQQAAEEVKEDKSKHRVLSESSRNLTVSMSENGRPSYVFSAPLVEGYTLGPEPYREFREGVEIITFDEDSLALESGRMTAKYAIYYEKSKLWEAVGNVEVKNSEGRELYTQQLFWNASAKMIYSNVETKIVDTKSGDIYIGEGFESDEEMNDWKFRKLTGRMRMEVKAAEDSEAEETTNQDAEKAVDAEDKTEAKESIDAEDKTKTGKPSDAEDKNETGKSTTIK